MLFTGFRVCWHASFFQHSLRDARRENVHKEPPDLPKLCYSHLHRHWNCGGKYSPDHGTFRGSSKRGLTNIYSTITAARM